MNDVQRIFEALLMELEGVLRGPPGENGEPIESARAVEVAAAVEVLGVPLRVLSSATTFESKTQGIKVMSFVALRTMQAVVAEGSRGAKSPSRIQVMSGRPTTCGSRVDHGCRHWCLLLLWPSVASHL